MKYFSEKLAASLINDLKLVKEFCFEKDSQIGDGYFLPVELSLAEKNTIKALWENVKNFYESKKRHVSSIYTSDLDKCVESLKKHIGFLDEKFCAETNTVPPGDVARISSRMWPICLEFVQDKKTSTDLRALYDDEEIKKIQEKFEKARIYFGLPEEYVKRLKEIKLSNFKYSENKREFIEGITRFHDVSDIFYLYDNKHRVPVSARIPSANELRSSVLQVILEEEKSINIDRSLFQAIKDGCQRRDLAYIVNKYRWLESNCMSSYAGFWLGVPDDIQQNHSLINSDNGILAFRTFVRLLFDNHNLSQSSASKINIKLKAMLSLIEAVNLSSKNDIVQNAGLEDAITTLHISIYNYCLYKIDYLALQKSCNDFIQKIDGSVLSNYSGYQGWQKALGLIMCIVVSILTLGIANAVAKARTGSWQFFKGDPKIFNARHLLEQIKSCIDSNEISQQTEGVSNKL